MDFNKIEDIQSNGFIGFKKTSDLWTDHSFIPNTKGVYLVLTSAPLKLDFLIKGSGGFFKGKDPNVADVTELENKWVNDAQVLYIGKATSLRRRLNQYLRFGQGKNIGHWGGRYIWQLKNHYDLTFCWKTTEHQIPRDAEKELIKSFQNEFNGRKPFANLVG